jgi:Leucine-rich repeat (LRR) protein
VTIDAPWHENDNKIRMNKLPVSVENFSKLERFNFSGHNISSVPLTMLDGCSLPNLTSMTVDGNPVATTMDLSMYPMLTFVPVNIFKYFKKMEYLNMNNTNVECVPHLNYTLQSMKRFDLQHTRVHYVPPFVLIPELTRPDGYPNVSVLLNGSNVSRKLDWSYEYGLTFEVIEKNKDGETVKRATYLNTYSFPTSLEWLNLAGNQFDYQTLPNFNRFANLQTLNLSDNLIEKSLWSKLEDLVQLKRLDLSKNRLIPFHLSLVKNGMTCNMLEKNTNDARISDGKQQHTIHSVWVRQQGKLLGS